MFGWDFLFATLTRSCHAGVTCPFSVFLWEGNLTFRLLQIDVQGPFRSGCKDLNDCKAAASYTVANLHVPALVGTMIPID